MRFFSLLTFTLCALPYYAYSYCVYNKLQGETYIDAVQAINRNTGAYSRFRKSIAPGEKECCPSTNADCNPVPTDPGNFILLYIGRVNEYGTINRFSVSIPAGGWVVVGGSVTNYDVQVKWPDGTNCDEAEFQFAGIGD
ncbi:hypothetical protein BJV82DRAFT_581768 [Fennellomyces sp. T-0311]|nr:hypothetical protein BJV82DRAFT_581767 [Fennellomyces sp. T-0311]KAI8139652.1 hypothetical protein BJV82DRAFT_581768 [Fennellomyces sp. T-0311]